MDGKSGRVALSRMTLGDMDNVFLFEFFGVWGSVGLPLGRPAFVGTFVVMDFHSESVDFVMDLCENCLSALSAKDRLTPENSYIKKKKLI